MRLDGTCDAHFKKSKPVLMQIAYNTKHMINIKHVMLKLPPKCNVDDLTTVLLFVPSFYAIFLLGHFLRVLPPVHVPDYFSTICSSITTQIYIQKRPGIMGQADQFIASSTVAAQTAPVKQYLAWG